MPTAEQVLASEFERGWQNLNLKKVYRKLFVLLPILGLTLRPCQEKKSKNFLNFFETSRIFLINQLGGCWFRNTVWEIINIWGFSYVLWWILESLISLVLKLKVGQKAKIKVFSLYIKICSLVCSVFILQ